MSHSVSFQRFESGSPAAIPSGTLLRVLSRHGFAPRSLAADAARTAAVPWTLAEAAGHPADGSFPEGCMEIGLVSYGNAPIGDVSMYMEAGTVTEVSIDRPSYDDRCKVFAFDLIQDAGLVMMPSYGGELYASAEGARGLTPSLQRQFGHMNLDVRSADDLWQ